MSDDVFVQRGRKPHAATVNGGALPGQFVRRFPVGAEPLPGGGTHFRVWAPKTRRLSLEFSGKGLDHLVELAPESGASGYFAGVVEEAPPGVLYKLRLDNASFPDPVSRFQPEGVDGPSEIIDPAAFPWSDQSWPGVLDSYQQVLYEMHVGTFTRAGTWAEAEYQLPRLRDLGITLVELMPVAEFAGAFGWGYDGVNLFAPYHRYGRPDDFRAFVNHAHGIGMGVILDVVYNHLGPRGNYLKEFSPDYFSTRYKNEWGEPINFDGENSAPVREFFTTNAAYWIEEYHLDGLRLDATQQVFDASPNHILGVITRRAREAAGSRRVYIVAESEPQDSRLVRPFEAGGHGMDAIWADDFHHSARVAATGRHEAYYSPFRGTPQELVSTAKHGCLYQGQYFPWQGKRRGSPMRGLHPAQFIKYLQNHDQVANSLHGLRLHQLTSPGRYRALTAFLLLSPGTPLLFQGQEFAASTPFLYFADHNSSLGDQVASGRKDFLTQFPSIAAPEAINHLHAPHLPETFHASKLNFDERDSHQQAYRLHRHLLTLRRHDPTLRLANVDGAVLALEAFALRYFGDHHQDRLLVVNLGPDLQLLPTPEPLLAPVEDHDWKLLWSSESPEYGGAGTPDFNTVENWIVPAHSALFLAPVPL